MRKTKTTKQAPKGFFQVTRSQAEASKIRTVDTEELARATGGGRLNDAA